jgi:hypothetical protein
MNEAIFDVKMGIPLGLLETGGMKINFAKSYIRRVTHDIYLRAVTKLHHVKIMIRNPKFIRLAKRLLYLLIFIQELCDSFRWLKELFEKLISLLNC